MEKGPVVKAGIKNEDRLRELEVVTKMKDDKQQEQIDFLLDEIHKKMNESDFDEQF